MLLPRMAAFMAHRCLARERGYPKSGKQVALAHLAVKSILHSGCALVDVHMTRRYLCTLRHSKRQPNSPSKCHLVPILFLSTGQTLIQCSLFCVNSCSRLFSLQSNVNNQIYAPNDSYWEDSTSQPSIKDTFEWGIIR